MPFQDPYNFPEPTILSTKSPYGYHTVWPQIAPPKMFTNKISDWTTWKKDTLLSFSLLGMDKVIKLQEYAVSNPEQNITI